MAKKIEQPTFDFEKALDDVLNAEPEEFVFMGKKRKIGWLRNEIIRKFSSLCAKEENQAKFNAKASATLLLNDVFVWFFGICYFFYWRWLYYVKNITPVDALAVINASKKKVPQDASLMVTILATGMTDLMMTMTKKEAKLSQVGRRGEQPTP